MLFLALFRLHFAYIFYFWICLIQLLQKNEIISKDYPSRSSYIYFCFLSDKQTLWTIISTEHRELNGELLFLLRRVQRDRERPF